VVARHSDRTVDLADNVPIIDEEQLFAFIDTRDPSHVWLRRILICNAIRHEVGSKSAECSGHYEEPARIYESTGVVVYNAVSRREVGRWAYRNCQTAVVVVLHLGIFAAMRMCACALEET